MRSPLLTLATGATATVATALALLGTPPASGTELAVRHGDDHPGQTSDGIPGIEVGPRVTARGSTAERRRNEVAYEIAPGVRVREWDQVDGRQPVGQVRLNLVTVDLAAANLSFEYLGPTYVPNRKPVSRLGKLAGALVAVNGDFFDISGTGAPLGVGKGRTSGLVTGGRTGWIPENMSMWVNRRGVPHMSALSVRWTMRQHPETVMSGFNQASVPIGQVGLYTSAWGRTVGRDVVNVKRRAREVIIRDRRVVANRRTLSDQRRIRKSEKVLIGVGPKGVASLKKLRRGQKVTFRRKLSGGWPRVAVSGDRPLLVDGVRRVVNDRLAHPRTAVGIDRDGGKFLFLVVDGRSTSSRGFTMVELADLMRRLGAEDALNLDGGGSSAMWTRRADGTMGVINEPSDGTERRVPNGFGLVFKGTLPAVVPLS